MIAGRVGRELGVSSMSGKAKWSVRNEPKHRTVYVTMSGLFDETSIDQAAREIVGATDSYRGQPHLCLADMRGLKAMKPAVAEILGKAIGTSRERGVVACAHMNDDIVARLQAARVARVHAQDGVTIEVASLEEAERVLDEQRATLRATPVRPKSA